MPCSLLCRVAPAAWLATALAAQAQSSPPPRDRDPMDARATVPALVYTSPFAPYRRLSDEKLISWREANDTVTRIGGWRVYAREAQQPEPAAAPVAMPPTPPAPLKTAPPMPAGHGEHKAP